MPVLLILLELIGIGIAVFVIRQVLGMIRQPELDERVEVKEPALLACGVISAMAPTRDCSTPHYLENHRRDSSNRSLTLGLTRAARTKPE
jgi:hypothetical protein